MLYICWIIFCGLVCIIGGAMGHNATFEGVLYSFFLLCLFPFLPYFYYLVYEKTKTAKNIFIVICCYLLLFIIICCYLLLSTIVRADQIILFYAGIIMHVITFIIIYKNKRQSK